MRVFASVGVLALGACGLLLWYGSRHRPSVWQRCVEGLASVSSHAFARGFAGGGSFFAGIGLIVWGTGLVLTEWVDSAQHRRLSPMLFLTIVGLTLVCAVATFAVSWLGRPRWCFPPHARDLQPPWQEALDARRKRRSSHR